LKTGYLVLENGQVFKGQLFGAEKETMAELVFTTSMVGYLEAITDPSYLGQMVVQTFPLIGNYGVIPEDFESEKPVLSAYIVREISQTPSNFRCQGKLEDYLKENGIPGLCGVDTRALTKVLRREGIVNAALVHELPEDIQEMQKKLQSLAAPSGVEKVTCKEKYTYGEGKPVVLWDLGEKKSLHKELEARDLKVTVVPATTTCEEILSLKPEGVIISNGPGVPAATGKLADQIAELMDAKVPVMGIGLGHQMMALAKGGKIIKLQYGHRGANQPVKDLKTGLCCISSQNHGYAVSGKSLPEGAKMRMININDETCEALEYTDGPFLSVQFYPQACGGPADTRYIYDEFVNLMGGTK